MKKHGKIIAILFVCLLSALAFFGCARVDTTSKAEIILDIASPLTAEDITVVSSAGTVSKSGKKVTIKLPNRRPVSVSISSDALKTIVLNFTAKDFKDSSTINRAIEFSSPLETVAKLNFIVDGDVRLNVADPSIKVSNRGNKFTLVIGGRDENKEYAFTALSDNIETYSGVIKGSDVLNGFYSREIMLAPKGMCCVEVTTNQIIGESILTTNYNLAPIYTLSQFDPSAVEQVYRFMVLLKKDDSFVLTSNNNKLLVRGDKVSTYGYKIDNSKKTYDEDLPLKLYVDWGSFNGYLYSKLSDGSFKEVKVVEERRDNIPGAREKFFIPLSDALEFHMVSYGSQNGSHKVAQAYKFTAQDLQNSAKRPLDSIIKDGTVYLDFPSTELAVKISSSKMLDYDTNVEIKDSLIQKYVYIIQTNFYNGNEYGTNQFYRKAFTLECLVDFGDYANELENFDIYCNGYEYDKSKTETSGNTKKIVFGNAACDKDGLLELDFSRNITTDVPGNPSGKIQVSQEFLYYDSSDISASGEARKLIKPIKLNNFTRIDSWILKEDFLDFKSIPGLEEYYDILVTSLKFVLTNEDEQNAKIINFSGNAYISKNAKLNLIYELEARAHYKRAFITLKVAKTKATPTSAQQDLTLQDFTDLYKLTTKPNPFTFAIIDQTTKITDLTPQKNNY